ncbi:MAG: hypothetical protein PHD81_01190 [Candidatus Nanoarchaeia archaeon]|nr:hypothetical protein [Candidatus Nanoarchaeia archaeon]
MFPLVNSAINIERNIYSTDETVLIKLQFENAPSSSIGVSDLSLYDNEDRNIAAPFYIVKFTPNLYYIYFKIPNTFDAPSYKFKLREYTYLENGLLKSSTEAINFNLKFREEPIISIEPAALNLNLDSSTSFNLNIKNNGKNSTNITLQFKEGNGTLNYNNFILNSGMLKQVSVSFTEPGYKTLNIKYNNKEYNLPILTTKKEIVVVNKTIIPVKSNITIPANKTNIITAIIKPVINFTNTFLIEKTPENAIQFVDSISKINFSLAKEETRRGELRFKNTFTKNITNIKFYVTGNLQDIVKLNTSNFDVIIPGEIKKQYVRINEDKSLYRNYEGAIILEYENTKLQIPVYVYFYKEPEGTTNKTTIIPKNEDIFANKSEISYKTETQLNTGRVLALLGIFFVVAVSFIIYYKARKAKKQKKSLFSFF